MRPSAAASTRALASARSTAALSVAAQIADYDAKVAALISDDDNLITYVDRLEKMVDEISDDESDDQLSIDDTDPEGLAAEVEQFLRDIDD